MNQTIGSESLHPPGESENGLMRVAAIVAAPGEEELVIDTPGGRYRAQFDDRTPVSSLGPLILFAQFLEASGRFDALCQDAPLVYRSANAPEPRDVVGTVGAGDFGRALALCAPVGVAL